MKSKTVYVCSECDYQSARWLGKCPQCNAWNSFTEETYTQPTKAAGSSRAVTAAERDHAVKFGDFELPKYLRHSTGISEFDRVLGGGFVEGSVVLLAGEPGIGKSTLLMQLCGQIGDSCKVLYVSGE